MTGTETSLIAATDVEHFQREGYVVLPRALAGDTVELLRGELDRFIASVDAEMDAAGTDVIGLNHRNRRYFVANRVWESEALQSFVFGDLLAGVCRALLGPDAWFFLEQYVVKYAEVGMTFSWHQDSGYLKAMNPAHERPYLTCWCALDDMTEENGTISVLPFSRGVYTGITDHVRDEETNDMVGYHGDDPGDLVVVPAGSIVAFSSTLLHRSGANTTDRRRRSYLVQYSAEPIMRADGAGPHINAEPFLAGGRRVR